MRTVLWLVVIPAFACGHDHRKDRSEARDMLDKIASKARVQFEVNGAAPIGKTKRTPPERCCTLPDHVCKDDSVWQQDPIWNTLELSVKGPLHYQYEYESTDGKSFVVHAYGDGDCDGDLSTWTWSAHQENGQWTTTREGNDNKD